MPLPNKLKKDAILEAICEFRFESDEMDELVLGRLSETVPWASFLKTRLPFSDLPAPMRKSDSTLRYQPLVELRDRDSPRLIKIGSNVVSAHVLAPYCGWAAFRPQLHEVLETLFKKFNEIRITRIGLRYVNALAPADHHIQDISGLRLKIQIDNEHLTLPFTLAYVNTADDITSIVKVASPSLVAGTSLPVGFIALIDVDICTSENVIISDLETGKAWLDRAHQTEKEEFFRLWPEDALRAATEEWT